jgi:hypothetical protein
MGGVYGEKYRAGKLGETGFMPAMDAYAGWSVKETLWKKY